MKHRYLLPLGLLVMGVVAGCNTTSSRISEKPAVFASLSPADQARIRQGKVLIGDSTDMVYIALGNPDKRTVTVSNNQTQTNWIYRRYYQRHMGTTISGYRRCVVYDPHSRQRCVIMEPVYSDLYREESQEYLRIVFTNGKVAEIVETVK
jgi:hypothetical protein